MCACQSREITSQFTSWLNCDMDDDLVELTYGSGWIGEWLNWPATSCKGWLLLCSYKDFITGYGSGSNTGPLSLCLPYTISMCFSLSVTCSFFKKNEISFTHFILKKHVRISLMKYAEILKVKALHCGHSDTWVMHKCMQMCIHTVINKCMHTDVMQS